MTLTLSHLASRTRLAIAALAAVLSLGAAVLLQAGTSAVSAGASGTSSAPSAAPTLADLARTQPSRSVEVIVQFSDASAFARGRALVAARGGSVVRDLHVIDALAVRMPAASAERLAEQPGVAHVSLNAAVRTSSAAGATSTSFLESTGTDRLWDSHPKGAGGTGKGVTVAVVDTGIAGDLPDFRTSATDASSRIVASVVTNPDATTENDGYGHGTHVAGLIAGNGNDRPAGDPLRGRYVGAAPDANLVSVKVADDAGNTSLIDVIYGLQFVVDHKDDYGIRVVNLSLSSATAESYKTDPLDAAVESAWKHGIVVVTAAGNRGTDADAVSYAPGNDPYAITVGAVDTQGTKRTSDDALASWSSRGVTQDGVAKPEVVAPGAHMVGPFAPGSAIGGLCSSCVTDGQYFKMGGTSMSSAVVAGIVADLLEIHPDWTPDQVKGALVSGLRHIDGDSGKTEVDADKADKAKGKDLVSNTGLTPSTLIDPATGDIDYDRASWSRASWSQVTGDRASWSRASWSRASWSRASWSCDCEVAVTGEADPARASWSRASWSASFSK